MNCPSCGHSNRSGARFCGNCAAPLTEPSSCPSCGAENPVGQRFCDACGEALPAEVPSVLGADADAREVRPEVPDHLAEKIRASRRSLEGERKQVTVLFADVVGSMDLAERIEAEQWRKVMEGFFGILCDAVHRFEGTVDKFTGDGAMALFGAPIAHEDHAQRACFAALHLQRELSSYATELRREQAISFAVRVGLNSGEVVVGSIGPDLGMEYTAIGHTVGLAQRMEQLAEPGKAFLTGDTASLVEGYFSLDDLGVYQIKGASRALRVHELTGVGAARGRLDISRARGFSRLVAREEELKILESTWQQALEGEGLVIGVVGEAGVGKSRLCHEFAERHRDGGVPVYHAAAKAHTKSVPLLPVLELLRTYFQITPEDSELTARERIAGKLLLLDERFSEDLPLMFDFLAVPDPERRPPRMDPEARQRLLLGLTKRLIRAESAREPAINVFEDLHWLDPASEVFLAHHVEAIRGSRSLTIVNFRPGYQAPWMSKSYYRQIALTPLAPSDAERMLAGLLGPDPSLARLPELICDRTAGNPFFIEELVQSLVESGSLQGERSAYRLVAPVTDAAVPATVQAVLSARIDRLSQTDKAVLQAAAVIGPEFSELLLTQVSRLEMAELDDALHNLVSAEFVYQSELSPEAVYAFLHPLTREVAYSSQLAERRAAMHAEVASAISEQNPDRLEELAALIAGHWQAAGEKLDAARWYARAAAWSGTNDPTRSLEHWREVQALADSLPESAESTALGLSARLSRLQFNWRLGVSHEEAESVFGEAERMATKSGNVYARALLLALYGAVLGISDGDVHEFAELIRRAAALAEESGDPALFVAVATSAYAMFCTGQLHEAVALLDRAIESAAGDEAIAADVTIGCPYAFCHIFKGGFESYLGRLEKAGELIEHGMTIAREHGDIETVGWGHDWAAWRAYLVGDFDLAFAHAQQSVEIAERIGDSFSRAWAWFWLGFTQASREQWHQAIDALERSATISRERRTQVESHAWRLSMLAESYLGAGDADRARALAEEGIGLARERRQPLYEALASLSLARVRMATDGAAADVSAGAGEEIKAVLARALQLARDGGFKSLEPLVHAELAKLAWCEGDQGERHRQLSEARQLFKEIGASAHAERVAGELAMAVG